MKYIYLYSSIVFNILTNVGFNLSALNETNPTKKWSYFAGGLVFGLINSILFTESLTGKVIPFQVASAVFFALTIIGLFLASHFIFKEDITWGRMAGVAFIIVGVIIVQMQSNDGDKLPAGDATQTTVAK